MVDPFVCVREWLIANRSAQNVKQKFPANITTDKPYTVPVSIQQHFSTSKLNNRGNAFRLNLYYLICGWFVF